MNGIILPTDRQVIGVVGGAGVGKGVVTDLLHEGSFSTTISLSNMLRMIATEFGGTHKRDTLDAIGNFLRGKYEDQGILAGFAVETINDHPEWDRIVVESIRHPDEVLRLQEDLGAFVIGITMPEETRFDLLKQRHREGDPTTKKGFKRLLRVEAGALSNGINIPEALEAADVVIHNDGTIDDFRQDTIDVLTEHGIHLEGNRLQPEREMTLPVLARR